MSAIKFRILLNQRLIFGRRPEISSNSLGTRQLSRGHSHYSKPITSRQKAACRPFISSANQTVNLVSPKSQLSLARSLGTQVQVQRPYVDPKFSYAYGRSSEYLIYSTVDQELERQVASRPDEVAFRSYYEDIQVTYKEFNRDVNKVAKALIKRFKISKGDSVGVFAYNCYNWVVVQFACSRIGAILTPINPSYKAQELAFVLKKGKVKCLFIPGPKSMQEELNDHMSVLQSDEIRSLASTGDFYLQHVILTDSENTYKIRNLSSSSGATDDQHTHDTIDFKLGDCLLHEWSATQENDGIIYRSSTEAEEAQRGNKNADDICIIDSDHVSPDDPFAVYYTSGTTGNPKGACISQFTAINNVNFCQLRLRNGRPRNWKAILVTCLPLFHIFAGVLNAICPANQNTVCVFSGYRYDIKQFATCIIETGANVITLTPTILIDLLTYIEVNNLSQDIPLKIIQSGGAALPPEVVAKTFKLIPELEEVRNGYGSTENGAVSAFQTIHEPHDLRPFTVGPPIDFSEIRIVKPGSEKILPLGEQGEIQTRGHNTMTEYLDDPAKTKEVLTPTKWYKTGDIGFMHPHGSIQISGRIKQMIIKGGENIYPEEIRELIHKLEFVEDCHVVGVPDKRFGEQVCAWVKLKPGYKAATSGSENEADSTSGKVITQDDILNYCKENITYFKVPKYLLFVDDFPMTPTKKVQHHIMTEKSVKMLGL